MAKKVVATLKKDEGKGYTKLIRMVKSEKSNGYSIKEDFIPSENLKDFLAKK